MPSVSLYPSLTGCETTGELVVLELFKPKITLHDIFIDVIVLEQFNLKTKLYDLVRLEKMKNEKHFTFPCTKLYMHIMNIMK